MSAQRSLYFWLGALTAVSIAGLLLLGLSGQEALRELDSAVTSTRDVGAAVRRQMDADMMHDAIRSDVYAALHAASENDAGQSADVAKDLAEHVERFNTNIAENAAADLSAEARAQTERIKPVIARYTGSAREVIELAASDIAAAKAKLPGFNQDFAALEDEMEKLSDLIQVRAEAAEGDARTTMQRAQWLMGGILLVTLLLAVLAQRYEIGRASCRERV